jgi:hypothetical protein
MENMNQLATLFRYVDSASSLSLCVSSPLHTASKVFLDRMMGSAKLMSCSHQAFTPSKKKENFHLSGRFELEPQTW